MAAGLVKFKTMLQVMNCGAHGVPLVDQLKVAPVPVPAVAKVWALPLAAGLFVERRSIPAYQSPWTVCNDGHVSKARNIQFAPWFVFTRMEAVRVDRKSVV